MKFNRAWLPLNGLRAFESTARHLSFTKAADELGVTQSAVSRQVQRLEELIGVKLIERRNREIELTPKGARLFTDTRSGMDLLIKSLKEVVEEDQQEVLRIALSASFAHCFGPGLLARFVDDFPDVRLDIDSKWNSIDIANSGYDLCITYAEPQITEDVMDLLWEEEVTPICAPTLARAIDTNDIAGALSSQTLLHVKTDAGDYQTWDQWGRLHGVPEAVTHRGMVFNTSVLGMRYALEGGGLVMTDPRLYERELTDGSLVTPWDSRCKSGYGYFLVMRRDDLNNERIQRYRNWFVDRFSKPVPLTRL